MTGRCCLCPNSYYDPMSRVCPGIPGSLHPEPDPCRFVKSYYDSATGLTYRVVAVVERNVISSKESQKTVYQICGYKTGPWGNYVTEPIYGYTKDTFDACQEYLNRWAETMGWEAVGT